MKLPGIQPKYSAGGRGKDHKDVRALPTSAAPHPPPHVPKTWVPKPPPSNPRSQPQPQPLAAPWGHDPANSHVGPLSQLIPLPIAGSSCSFGYLAAQSCPTLCDPMDCSPLGSSVHGILQVRVGSCSLLQGICPTQGLNPGLPRCRQTLYCLSHEGSSLAQLK